MGKRSATVSRVIKAPPEKIFEILSDASLHPVIDGSGMVKSARGNPERLRLGTRFGMSMRLLTPYRTVNTVTEYEESKQIAWRPYLRIGPVQVLGGQTWRYKLEPVEHSDGGRATRVSETYDWGTAMTPLGLELAGYPKKMTAAMKRTLERLEDVVTR